MHIRYNNKILKLQRRITHNGQLNFIVKFYKSFLRFKSYLVYATGSKPVSLSKKTIQEYNQSRTVHSYKYICHAPFTNLYFGYDGKIGVCCYNRSNIMGNYPEESIQNAWDSKKLKNLRKRIKKIDLRAGCYACKTQWDEKAYKTILARNYDYFSPDLRYPKSMEFELSNRCNLECIMCSEENSSTIAQKKLGQKERLYPYDDSFVKQLIPYIPHLQSTKFLGGEPLLIPIYYKIWKLIIENNPNCEIVVQTNGTVLNDSIKALLEKGNFSISISIDSLVKETYETIRKNAKFEEVFSNLQYFIDLGKRKNRFVGIVCCFIQQNWKEIPDFIRYFNKKQIPISFNRVWAPPQCSIWESSYVLTSEILSYYSDILFETNTSIEQQNTAAFRDLINLVTHWNEQEKIKYQKDFRHLETPVETLETLIISHILGPEISTELSEKDKIVIQGKFKSAIENFRQHENYKSILIKMLEIPSEILQMEILNNSEQRLQQQLLDILKNEKP